ncbi:chloride channel protein [Thiohalobacter sp. IOR34]|uniref:chloride channel protein n=1 Tax=Thiohalobacter sp. IOR34 TaxID=3057176 RepID=UPI0025B17B80|nr:chloride channel protein [Thiohalobacter sp. IOR34]WJW75137.1 chloride channel protein [Thiohalobacter sp. IOR34]
MLHRIRKSGRELLSPEAWKTRIVFWSGAVVVGLLAALFAYGTEYANEIFAEGASAYAWLPFLLSPLGLGLIAWLTRRYVPGASGSGIPQAIAALGLTEHASRTHLLSFRIAFSKIGLCLLGMLSGASIGREGPTVHVGAAVMFSLGRFARFPHHYMDRGLILAGGAAGIAAAFNTPLAGILFAIEEMGRSFEERTSGTLLTAVFLAGITAVAIQGNYIYFGTSAAQLQPGEMLLPILICGVVGGGLGGLFAHGLVWSTRRIAALAGHRPVLLAMACGLAIASIGYLSGGLTFGTGYQEARQLVTGQGELPGEYAFLKMAATWFSYLSGIPGGIFAPSLAAGAGVGAIIADWLPGLPLGAIVILGMVGYFTGVVQTPITAFVIVMEMTDNNALLLPLMATAFLAYATSRVICPEPIYRALAQNFLPQQPSKAKGGTQP